MSKAVSRLFDYLRIDGRDKTPAESSQCSFSQETISLALHHNFPAEGDKFMKKSSQKPIHNKQPLKPDPPDDDARQIQICGSMDRHFQDANGSSQRQKHLRQSENRLSDVNDVVLAQPIPRLQKHAQTGVKCLDKLRKRQSGENHINDSASEESASNPGNHNNTFNHGGQFITPDPHNNNVQDLYNNIGAGQNKRLLPSSRCNNDGFKQNSTLTSNQQNKRKRGRPRKNERPPTPERTPALLKRTASTRSGGGSFLQQQPKESPKMAVSDQNQGENSVASRYGDDRNASQLEPDHRIQNRDNTKMASNPPSSSLSSEESSEVQVNGVNTNQPEKMKKESTLPSTEKQTSEERVFQLHKSKEPLSKSCIASSSNESSSKVSMILANNSMAKNFQQPPIASNISSPLLSTIQAPKLPKTDLATPLMPVQPPIQAKKIPRQLTVLQQRRKMTKPSSQRRRGGVSSSSSSSSHCSSSEDDEDGDGAGKDAAAALKEPKPLIHNEQIDSSSDDEESKGDDGLSHQLKHQVHHHEQLSLQGAHQIFQLSNPPVNQDQAQMLHQMTVDSHSFTNSKQIGVQHQQQQPYAATMFQRNPNRSSLSIGRGDIFQQDNTSPARLSQFDIHKEPDINWSQEQNHGALYDFDQEPNRRIYPSNTVEIGDIQGYIQRMPSSSSLLNYGLQAGSFLNLNGSSNQLRPPPTLNMHSNSRIDGHEPMGFSFQSQQHSSVNISPRPRVQSDLSRGGGLVGDSQFHHQNSNSLQQQQQQTMFNFDISSHHLYQNEGLYGSHSGPSHISHMLGETLVSPRHYQHQNRPSRPL